MDEVIADVQPKFLDYYERDLGRRLTREDYWGKKIYEVGDARHIRDYLFEKGFFADLPVMPHSVEVLLELMENYDLFITSAAMEFPMSLEDKYEWMRKHFPFIHWKNMVFCGDKSIILADYMIDDHPHNLRGFTGTGLLYTASHNIGETDFIRVDNWLDIREFFRRERAGEQERRRGEKPQNLKH
jgi:5'(3')-deoxyribonucleotidase